MATKQARSVRKLKPKHRAVKPRLVRPLDVAKADNHAARHAAKRAAHEALLAKQAADMAATLEEAHGAALVEDVRRDIAADVEEAHAEALEYEDDSAHEVARTLAPAEAWERS